MNKNENFNIEDSLFNIIKIHYKKQHSTTNRISKENRDLTYKREKDIIKQEIIRTIPKKMQMRMKFNIINFMSQISII